MSKDRIIAQCARCNQKKELKKIPSSAIRCSECQGPTHVYTSKIMSPEEIAARYGPPGSPVPKKEEITMSDFTKDKYLQMRLKGKGRTAIMNELFPSNKVKFYRYLKEWGIKEQEAEEQALDLLQAELKAKQTSVAAQGDQPAAELTIAEPEASEVPVAPAESPEPKPDPTIAETSAAPAAEEPIAEPAIALVDDPATYQVSPATPRSNRTIRIEAAGSQSDIEAELMAMLGYVQAMRGKSFRLELYLGEVAD